MQVMRLLLAAVLFLISAVTSASAEVDVPYLDPQNLTVGKTFRCFSDSATCTTVTRLGQGSFGVAWKVQVQLDASSLHTSQTPAAQLIRDTERFVQREHNDEDKDGRRFFVAAKFQLEGCDANKNCRTKAGNVENALREVMAWARLPPHPDVVDLLHVDIFGGCRLVLYSEYLEGAVNLEKALHHGAKGLLADGCSQAHGELVTDEQYKAAKKEIAAIMEGVIEGYTKFQREQAAHFVSRCKRMGKKTLLQKIFWGEPEVPAQAHSAAECAAARKIIYETSGRHAPSGSCPPPSVDRCRELKALLKLHDEQVADRALLLDRVAWQLASGLKHVHDNGVTHFDLAPDNIIVTPGLDVYITDFGTSRRDTSMGSGKLFLFPCEWKYNRTCAKKKTYEYKSSSDPLCSAVDTYALALTLTMLYSGHGFHEVLGQRDGEKLAAGPRNFFVKPLSDVFNERVQRGDQAACKLAGSMTKPNRVEDIPSKAFDNRSNRVLPKMSNAVQAILSRELSSSWRHRSADAQTIVDAIESAYGSHEKAMASMGLMNEAAHVDAHDELWTAANQKNGDAIMKCKRGNLLPASAGYAEAVAETKMTKTFIHRSKSFLYAAAALTSRGSGCASALKNVNDIANTLYEEAYSAAIQGLKQSESKADKMEAKGLLRDSIHAMKNGGVPLSKLAEGLALLVSMESEEALNRLSPFKLLAEATNTPYESIQVYCATAAYFTWWLWNKSRQAGAEGKPRRR